MNFMDIEQLKNLLRNHGIRPNFTFGQNFLIDETVLEDILDAAAISSDDTILEIGPGIGNLTRLLCERAGFVLSVEKDPSFLPILHNIKKDYRENFRFEIADILEYNFQSVFSSRPLRGGWRDNNQSPPLNLPPFAGGETQSYKVVANIPYYITGKILEMLMTAKFKPSSITVLAQKEVAERVTALPGDMSLLAISVQLYGDPKFIRKVPANCFYPAPKVDSAILHIKLFEKPRFEIRDEKKFFGLLRACFSGKRKQLHNTLTNNLRIEKQKALAILEGLGIDPKIRPQELTIEEWAELSKRI